MHVFLRSRCESLSDRSLDMVQRPAVLFLNELLLVMFQVRTETEDLRLVSHLVFVKVMK